MHFNVKTLLSLLKKKNKKEKTFKHYKTIMALQERENIVK